MRERTYAGGEGKRGCRRNGTLVRKEKDTKTSAGTILVYIPPINKKYLISHQRVYVVVAIRLEDWSSVSVQTKAGLDNPLHTFFVWL